MSGYTGNKGERGDRGVDGNPGKTGKAGKTMIALRGKQGPPGPAGKAFDPKEVQSLKEATEITTTALKKMPDFRKLAMGLQDQIDRLANPVVVDLDSQCDGSNLEFDIGTGIGPILFVNNNGGILTRSEWSRSGSTLTLVYAPDSGEELEVIGLKNI